MKTVLSDYVKHEWVTFETSDEVKLDQLIDRAHQLGSFTEQLIREDQTGPNLPSSKTFSSLPRTSRFASPEKEPSEQVNTPEALSEALTEKSKARDQ